MFGSQASRSGTVYAEMQLVTTITYTQAQTRVSVEQDSVLQSVAGAWSAGAAAGVPVPLGGGGDVDLAGAQVTALRLGPAGHTRGFLLVSGPLSRPCRTHYVSFSGERLYAWALHDLLGCSGEWPYAWALHDLLGVFFW